MLFEISKRKNKNGRRKFKIILHEIYPDSCIDIINEQGTLYNINGITWIREYCEKQLSTIEDTSLRVEFLDDDRTEICGHGETGIVDGLPVFENATVIGHFKKGYIDTFIDDEGNERLGVFGEGEIDEMCYYNFVSKLKEEIENGNAPFGSVEIFCADGKDSIEYKYGYKEEGRIPMNFRYSGYALLGVAPADRQSKIVELNKRTKEENDMTDEQIKEIVALAISEQNSSNAQIAEINSQCQAKIEEANSECQAKIDEANTECEAKIEEANAQCQAKIEEANSECEAKVEELNAQIVKLESEKNEAIANSTAIQAALDEVKAEQEKTRKELEALWEERNELEKMLGEARAKERVGQLSSAISVFTEEQKDYAKAEIEAFNADPLTSEINSVVNKIYEGIGVKALAEQKAEAKRLSEINAEKKETVVDIFTEIQDPVKEEDTNIF